MTAIISSCGRYRYRLERTFIQNGPTALFVMVNPSIADGVVDDPTIRKLIGFGRRHGVGRLIVCNLFALRSTDVRALLTDRDPVGPDNDAYLAAAVDEAHFIVPAWGPLAKQPPAHRMRGHNFMVDARRRGKALLAWGPLTADGQPRHPLMTPYEAPLIPL